MEPRRPGSRARDATYTIPDLCAARTTHQRIAARVAYLAGPCPPAPAIQRRMLRTLAHDLRTLGAQLARLDTLDTRAPARASARAPRVPGERGGAA